MIADLSRPYRRARRTWDRELRVALALVLAMFLVVFLARMAEGGTSGGGPDQVVVHPGDTLWSIAAARSDGGDVREVVDRIMTANHLSGPVVIPGELLIIPPG